jgi:hypothetical protein
MSDLGGAAKVPISWQSQADGQTVLGGTTYNRYQVQLWSSNGNAQSVSITAPPGCSANPTTVNVPATGSATFTALIPQSQTGQINFTADESGYQGASIPVQT